MALTRPARFAMLSRIVEVVRDDPARWDLAAQNRLLRLFGITDAVDGWDGPVFGELIEGLSDEDLAVALDMVVGSDSSRADDPASSEVTVWTPARIRLFVSHSGEHEAFAVEVADALLASDVHAFVAHRSMKVSQPWQSQIEQALRTMQVFVVLVHPETESSVWCQQEIGWALGRGVPRFAVRFGRAPAGFLARDQWPNGDQMEAADVAAAVRAWLSTLPGIAESLADDPFAALASARSYIDAGQAARRVAELGSISPSQWARLDAIYWANDQVHGGALPNRPLRILYQEHGRPWPPPRDDPRPSPAAQDG